MISLASLRRLEQLQLSSSRRLAGLVAGEHRSNRQGTSLDFVDFRTYQPGDDVRRIDLHHLARHDELRVKLFEADEDLVVRVLLDTSTSMTLHGKHTAAAALVAAIGSVTMTSGDSFSLQTFPASPHPQRFVGRSGTATLLATLQAITWGGSTPFAKTTRALLSQPGPPGMTIVVSDLLTPDWRECLTRLPSRGAELLVAHIGAIADRRPALAGDLALVDVESGEQIPVSLTPADLEDYRNRHEAWRAQVRRRCLDVGGRYLAVDAGEDIEQLLMRSWRRSGVLR